MGKNAKGNDHVILHSFELFGDLKEMGSNRVENWK
jgi:hypothetical protein